MSDIDGVETELTQKSEAPVMRVELEVPDGVDLLLIINGVQIDLD
jgi:hypothetical protein